MAFKFNEQQDLAYNVRRAIPEHLEIFQQWREDADRYQSERPDALMDLQYGPDPRHRLDVFPAIGQEAGESSPLAIVIHGGYWQALDKADNRHVCRSLCDAGWTVALLNYRLCPAVNIGDICDDVEAATHWLVHKQQEWRLDCTDIAVIGHSAGAHLAAMLACRIAEPLHALGARIGSLALVSGVFALECIIGTRMNERLSLDPSTANRWSPNRYDPPRAIRVDSTVGERETRGFFDQQRCLADAWRSKVDWSAGSIPDADHLHIWSQLADPASPMAQRLVAHLGSKT